VRLHELPAADRPEVIAEYMRDVRRRSGEAASAKAARFYFGLDPDATTDDIARVADRYPVFRVEYLG
jgi:hypothetical protein